MKSIRVAALCCLISAGLMAQNFDLIGETDSYSVELSKTLEIPLKIKNLSDKPQFYVVRLINPELSGTQKGYFCFNKTCLEPGVTEFSKRVEPWTVLEGLSFYLESGLVTGQFPLNFEVFVKGNINTLMERTVHVSVEEKSSKNVIYQSRDISMHELYPNPATEFAMVEYKLTSDQVKARLIVHNILGSALSTHELPLSENKLKIETNDLTPGVYFYTLYLDNIGVLTRKLIVRR